MVNNGWEKLTYVQIAGNQKSGTSLLMALLDDHPDVAAFPSETSVTGLLFPVLSDPTLSKAKKLDAIITKRCSKETDGFVPASACNLLEVGKRLRYLANDLENNATDLHYGLLQAFYDVFNANRLKTSRIWIDKSPLSHLFADEVFSTYPNVKYIHILREPKNNFSSVGGTALKRIKSRLKREALVWRYRIWSAHSFYYAKRNLQKYGDERYKIIRFQDLVRNPKEVIPDLAEFIGIPEMDTLYQPTRAGYNYYGNNKNGMKFNGISTVNVDRWKERIPVHYARVMESQPMENMKPFGYERYFNVKEIKRALFVHRLITSITPRSTRLRHFHPRHFKSPGNGIPGI